MGKIWIKNLFWWTVSTFDIWLEILSAIQRNSSNIWEEVFRKSLKLPGIPCRCWKQLDYGLLLKFSLHAYPERIRIHFDSKKFVLKWSSNKRLPRRFSRKSLSLWNIGHKLMQNTSAGPLSTHFCCCRKRSWAVKEFLRRLSFFTETSDSWKKS